MCRSCIEYNIAASLMRELRTSAVIHPLYSVNTSLLAIRELCNRIRTPFDVFNSTARA
jgi:hypothetical protein